MWEFLGCRQRMENDGTYIETIMWRHWFADGTSVSGRRIRRVKFDFKFTGFQA